MSLIPAGVKIDTEGIGKAVSGIGDMAVKIREAITGKKIADPVKMAEIERDLDQIQANVSTAQTKINEQEAGSGNMFVAGWRPFIGWVCGVGLVWGVFIHPIWVWLSKLIGIVEPPEVQVAALITILLGMLGLGTQRSYEKKHGVQNQH